ncbi:uncharacterized protein LTR77_006007 [Saxophila tyrrhenica]|uniref:Uncharacterized protein n=1 Tax=Saxophila tyrrhenica TaxID=1690608 RepID=A0AAV9P6P1_9PEZI|nr:hypothetical protein LTR77_006007 [Saxophila tyrrhenica]
MSEGTYRLVTVNTAPERAQRLIGIVAEAVKDRYAIEHVANCEGEWSIGEVEAKLKEVQPDLLFCASMWTAEESEGIQQIGRDSVPGIKTYAIPHGLQVNGGPDAVVEHLKKQIPLLLD